MHAVCFGCDGDVRTCIDKYARVGGFSGLYGVRHEMEKVTRSEVLLSNLDIFHAVVYRAVNVFHDVFSAAGDVITPHL